LAPMESAYATSYWSSIVTLVISCPVSEILQVFCWEERPHPHSTRILGCSPWTRLPLLPTYNAHGTSALQTDGRLTIAVPLPCFALRASCGKKLNYYCTQLNKTEWLKLNVKESRLCLFTRGTFAFTVGCWLTILAQSFRVAVNSFRST